MPELTLQMLGRYKLLRVIGRGAMGIVYEAIDPDIDRVVAIKTINLMLSAEEMEQYEARFKQEIKAVGRLNHPNIVTIYDVGKTDHMAYMAMEFIDGCELKALLKAGLPLPIDVALNIIAQAAEGLAFAHSRDIIHRDVKPANIMLLENEEGMVAKITDFGIARMPASAVKTMTGMVLGSPRYMSPEQVIGKNISARSDVFSLGVVLYEALTGTAPFEADSISSIMYQTVHVPEQPPSTLNPDVAPDLDAIVAKALAKLPDDRFESMKSFARKLREVIREREGGAEFSLEQLRTSLGMPTMPTPSRTLSTLSKVPSVGRDVDGTRLTRTMPTPPAEVGEHVVPPPRVTSLASAPVLAPAPAPVPASVVVSAPATVPETANTRAAITLTMDALPPRPPRKIPIGPLLLLGSLATVVVVLSGALLMSL